jgi:hypothetical protein
MRPNRGCNNCAARGPWRKNDEGHDVAECLHPNKPSFWGKYRPLMVGKGFGSKCKLWVPIREVSKD